MFETEMRYFVDHQAELVKKHAGKTLVIKGAKVVGVYLTPLQAFVDASTRFEPGTFMIQPCEAGPEAYTVTIASVEPRVIASVLA